MSSTETKVVTFCMVLVAAGLAALSTKSLLLAALAGGLSLFLLALIVFGAHRVALGFLGIAFLTAPAYRGLLGGHGSDIATPTDVCVALAVLLLLPEVMQKRVILPAMLTVPLGVLTVLGLFASVAANSAPLASMLFVAQWLLVFGVLPAFLLVLAPSIRVVDFLMWAYLLGQMASTAKAFITGASVIGRYQGLSHHPNDFGLAGSVAAVCAIYLFMRYKNLWVKFALVGMGAISLYSIVMSGSRGSTLAIAVVIVFIPLVERSGLWAFALTLFGAIGLALLPFVVDIGGAGGSLSRLAGDQTTTGSDTVRGEALSSGWERFLHSPFTGYGIDPLVGVYHNLFLEVAVAVGVFGVAAYLVLLYFFCQPIVTMHPLRRLSYIPWLFVVSGITFPGLVDRTILVPMAISVLACVPASRLDLGDLNEPVESEAEAAVAS